MAQRFAGVVISCLAMMPLVAAGQSDRLSVLFEGTATLNVSGDQISCALLVPCPMYCDYCNCWGLCDRGGTRALPAQGSYLVMGGLGGAGAGSSYGSSAQLTVNLNFRFRYSRPTVTIEGFSYTPKTTLGFGYFVDKVQSTATAGAVADCTTGPWGRCDESSANSSSRMFVSTSVVKASASALGSAWCRCVERGEYWIDCTSGGNDQSERARRDPPSGYYRGVSPSSVSFGNRSEATYVHKEELSATLSLSAQAGRCAGAGCTGIATAYAGLLLKSAPHPLGVPAIGENEYVWSSDRPARLEIPARAYAHAWGWEPDLGWIAERTLFRVEPSIESEQTEPGFRTIAVGRQLIAQTRDQYGFRDDLIFIRAYLPPSNNDFGLKRVYFTVDGNKVDHADVEIFFPPDAKNHPPGEPPGYEMQLEDTGEDCPRWRRLRQIDTPNWFYYYYDAYAKGRIDRVYYLAAAHGSGYSSGAFYDIYDDGIYIGDRAHPIYGNHKVYLFCLKRRADSYGRERQLITFVDQLTPNGIHKFIALLEHEQSHRKYYTAGISRCDWGDDRDPDDDSLPSWWERIHGLDPMWHNTTGAPGLDIDPDGDSDAVAEIEAFGALTRAEGFWKHDWAQGSMQWGTPPSPFPWMYDSTSTNRSRHDRCLLRSVPRTNGR